MSNYPIRWMIRRDMPAVLDIENVSFGAPWPEEEFIRCLRQRNCIGMVATDGPSTCPASPVVGYMLYDLHHDRIDVINFAVAPQHRRQGVGRAMIGKLRGKLSPLRRRRITLHVGESNLGAQLFFRAMGLRAVGIARGAYDHRFAGDEDAYEFECGVESQEGCGV